MSSYSEVISLRLGVEITSENPFLFFDGTSLHATSPKKKEEYLEQQRLFEQVIVKLNERVVGPSSDDPLELQAEAIFTIAMTRMQRETNEVKQLRKYRTELVEALRRHKSEHLFRSLVKNPGGEKGIAELTNDLATDLADKLSLLPKRVKVHTRQSGMISPREGDEKEVLEIAEKLELTSNPFSRVKRGMGRPSSDLSALFSPQTQQSSSSSSDEEFFSPNQTGVGRLQQELIKHERIYSAIIKSLDDDTLRDYLNYWKEHGVEYPDPFHIVKTEEQEKKKVLTPLDKLLELSIEEQKKIPLGRLLALHVDKQIHAPVGRLVCQERVIKVLKDLPSSGSKGAQDFVRSLSGIAVVGEPPSEYNLTTQAQNDNKTNYLLVTGRFREILQQLITKLSTDQETFVDKWDQIVLEVANTYECDEESPNMCFNEFFAYLLGKVETSSVAKKLSYLLRASFQDSYSEPGQEVAGFFPMCRSAAEPGSISIEYAFTAHGEVKVTLRAKQIYKKKEHGKELFSKKPKKEKELFSLHFKNTLTATLESLPNWKSEIILEVPSGPKESYLEESVFTPLLKNGFLTTRKM